MSTSRLSQRYARALQTVEEKLGPDAATFSSCLEALNYVFKQSEAASYLSSPAMPTEGKLRLLDQVLEKIGATTALRNFLKVVADAGRIALIPQIIIAFNELSNAAKGVLHGVVNSVIALESADLSQLALHLSKELKHEVQLTQRLEPALLGGFTVQIGNFLLDSSLKTRIEALASQANH